MYPGASQLLCINVKNSLYIQYSYNIVILLITTIIYCLLCIIPIDIGYDVLINDVLINDNNY